MQKQVIAGKAALNTAGAMLVAYFVTLIIATFLLPRMGIELKTAWFVGTTLLADYIRKLVATKSIAQGGAK